MSGATDLIARRRDKLCAVLLAHKEKNLDPYLPAEISTQYRKLILDAVNGFADVMMDLLGSLDDDSVWNELWLSKIDDMHSGITEIRNMLRVG